MDAKNYPVAVIGAGPVGLAAAAHVLARGLTPVVLEAGSSAGASIMKWGHVRIFSPWFYNVDAEARLLLQAEGWQEPDAEAYPTGREFVENYLKPLSETSALKPCIRYDSKVTAVTKFGKDVMKNQGRNDVPFLVRVQTQDGYEYDLLAQAVIDASGTFEKPNPMGSHGIPVAGEQQETQHIAYGIPDVAGKERDQYAGQRVLVVGSGHSAFNVLQDLVRLKQKASDTLIYWAIRKTSIDQVFGGGEHDKLQERGRLGSSIRKLVEEGAITLMTGVSIERLERTKDGLVLHSNRDKLLPVDKIIVTTGFRPDLQIISEIRLSLDPGTQSPTALATLIDPNLHSCGTVKPHGAEELKHPDENFYIVGMKSYGRAPTFLLLTGYEQVRSVTFAIAGDWEAARRVELVLPETGVCSTRPGTSASLSEKVSCGSSTHDQPKVCCG
ncbi:MAG TPA: FAD-dependent oxidoreductase [Oligoflexus sp.]|uniref:FAD-dependent oxidoreductase n=1 Tax=Oligoflexus sp. TaxID=1971216 RepID=UPI002D6D92DC|nr:FAD-dependent oxidoreductase [Oligoflexus sp.]HYX38390.1 FAD-dependent oxidoreductase [Oligoflexus sp.]